MNSDERLLQVLESSACLRKTQLLAYLNKELFPEELRVVEIHLAECGLCNEALEGFDQSGNARVLIDKLHPPVLPVTEEREKKGAQPATTGSIKSGIETVKGYASERSGSLKEKLPIRRKNNSWLGAVGIAALLLIGFGLIWQFELKHKNPSELITLGSRLPEPQQQGTGIDVAESEPKQQTGIAPPPEGEAGVSTDEVLATDSVSGNALTGDTPVVVATAAVRKDSLPVLAAGEGQKPDPGDTGLSAEKEADADKLAARSVSKTAAPKKEEQPKKVTAVNTAENLSDKPPAQLTDFETGVDLYKKKQYASALLYLKAAASNEANPRHWDAVYYSALCNKRLDKTGRAKRLFRSIIRAGAPQKSAAEKQLESMSGSSGEE